MYMMCSELVVSDPSLDVYLHCVAAPSMLHFPTSIVVRWFQSVGLFWCLPRWLCYYVCNSLVCLFLYSARALCRHQLVLVDRGVLRPGDSFVSGMLWGFVRSIFDEEGCKLLEQAGAYFYYIMCTERTRPYGVLSSPLVFSFWRSQVVHLRVYMHMSI